MAETSSVLGEGRQMPSFELPDEGGRRRKLLEYLDEGPVILVFYREDW
jgi:peroxiredoxin